MDFLHSLIMIYTSLNSDAEDLQKVMNRTEKEFWRNLVLL